MLKKTILKICLLCLVDYLHAQPVPEFTGIDTSLTSNQRIISSYKVGQLDGKQTKYFRGTDQVQVKTNYVKGRKEGQVLIYSQEGILVEEVNYAKDTLNGWLNRFDRRNGTLVSKEFYEMKKKRTVIHFYANEKKKKEEQYDLNEKVAERITWYENGQMRQKDIYKDGQYLHQKLWHENGQVSQETPFKDGKVDGEKKRWDEKGELIYKSDFVAGQIEGDEIIVNNKAGKTIYQYKAGKKEGPFTSMTKDGQLHMKGENRNGKLYGRFQQWYPNGQLQFDQFYDDKNRYQGYKYNFYENGNLKSETHYLQGHADGVQRTWYENGQLSSINFSSNDRLAGLRMTFYENGIKKSHSIDGVRTATLARGETYVFGKDFTAVPNWYVSWHEDGTVDQSHWFDGFNVKEKSPPPAYIKNKYLGMRKGKLVAGKKEGDWIQTYDDGSPMFIERFKAGRLDGTLEVFNEKSLKIAERNYKDGMLDGSYFTCDWNGLKLEEGSFEKNKRVGERTIYKKGKLYKRYEYYDGYLNYKEEMWYDNGQKRLSKKMKRYGPNNGSFMEYGEGAEWSEDGVMLFRREPSDDLEIHHYWFPNGSKRYESIIKDRKKNGLDKAWYENGTLKWEAMHKDGERDGHFKFYDENSGLLKMEGEHVEGKKEGEWTIYNGETGDYEASHWYEAGVKTKTTQEFLMDDCFCNEASTRKINYAGQIKELAGSDNKQIWKDFPFLIPLDDEWPTVFYIQLRSNPGYYGNYTYDMKALGFKPVLCNIGTSDLILDLNPCAGLPGNYAEIPVTFYYEEPIQERLLDGDFDYSPKAYFDLLCELQNGANAPYFVEDYQRYLNASEEVFIERLTNMLPEEERTKFAAFEFDFMTELCDYFIEKNPDYLDSIYTHFVAPLGDDMEAAWGQYEVVFSREIRGMSQEKFNKEVLSPDFNLDMATPAFAMIFPKELLIQWDVYNNVPFLHKEETLPARVLFRGGINLDRAKEFTFSNMKETVCFTKAKIGKLPLVLEFTKATPDFNLKDVNGRGTYIDSPFFVDRVIDDRKGITAARLKDGIGNFQGIRVLDGKLSILNDDKFKKPIEVQSLIINDEFVSGMIDMKKGTERALLDFLMTLEGLGVEVQEEGERIRIYFDYREVGE